MNVISQVQALSHTPVVQAAWLRGQVLNLYGWVYGLEDGRVKELKVSVLEISDVDPTYRYDAQCEEPS